MCLPGLNGDKDSTGCINKVTHKHMCLCVCLSCEAGIPTREILISLPVEFPVEPKAVWHRHAHVCKINESILFVHRYTGRLCSLLLWVLGLGRSPGGGQGSPLQCSCLENPMDRRAWRATVLGVTKPEMQLSD